MTNWLSGSLFRKACATSSRAAYSLHGPARGSCSPVKVHESFAFGDMQARRRTRTNSTMGKAMNNNVRKLPEIAAKIRGCAGRDDLPDKARKLLAKFADDLESALAAQREATRNEAFNLGDTVIELVKCGDEVGAREAIRESFAALSSQAAATQQGEAWPATSPGYDRLFDAIAAAASVHAGGVGVNVSVTKFLAALTTHQKEATHE